MRQYIIWLIFFPVTLLLSACQLDAETSKPVLIVRQTETPTSNPTPLTSGTVLTDLTALTKSTLLPSATPSPTVSITPSRTPSATPSATPTDTPTPTQTPVPSERLVLGRQAYASSNYEIAHREFDALLTAPGAEPDEKRQALYWRGRSELELGDTAASIASLKMFLQRYPTDEFNQAAQFNLGRAYEQSAQPQEAVDAYLGAIMPDDPVNVYIYELIGDIGLKTGMYTETVTAYQAGIDATDDLSFKVHLREGIAEAELVFKNDPQAAIDQYKAILTIAKVDSYRAKILRLIGDAYLTLDDPDTARDYYLEAVERYPEAYDSYLALVELVNANVPVDDFQRGLIDYYAEAYQPAIDAFKRYLAQPTPPVTVTVTAAISSSGVASTTSKTADQGTESRPVPLNQLAEATWFMALSWQALGQYNSAILTFQRLIDRYPDSPNWGDAHLEIGKTLIRQGSYSRAKAILRDFAGQRPNHPLAPEAVWRAARLDMSDDLFDEAHTHLHALVTAYPKSEYAPDSLYWAGQSAYQLEDYAGAIEDWAMLVDKYPDSDLVSFGGYWRARALLELGQEEEARTVLMELADKPIDYYILRARDLLNGEQSQPTPISLPSLEELEDEQAEAEAWLQRWLDLDGVGNLSAVGTQIQSGSAFRRGDALLDLGLRDKALIEFEAVKENWWDNALAMYQLSIYFREKGLGQLSIISAARVIFLSPARAPEDAPRYVQRLYYPIYFEDVVFDEATALDIDPALVAAIIRQESLFELSAQSYVGARGLMQVMPATGEYIAERSGFNNFDIDQLWRPYISIKFGAWYIDQQLRIFEGNEFAALAAYNAGPGNVLEWIKTSDDLDIFVESIPFLESRQYIRKIYVNLVAYRRVYGE